jgi:hypothetical protein
MARRMIGIDMPVGEFAEIAKSSERALMEKPRAPRI